MTLTSSILGLVGMIIKEPLSEDEQSYPFALVKCIDEERSHSYTSRINEGESFVLVKVYGGDDGQFHVFLQDGNYTGQNGSLSDFEEVENPEEEVKKFDLDRLFDRLGGNNTTEECLEILL